MFNYQNNIIAILLSMVILASPLVGKDYNQAFDLMFFGRQPSARAEAMGKSMVATDAGGFASYYNPALVSLNQGLTVSASHASPYYGLDQADYTYIGATYQAGRLGSAGLSMFQFDWGERFFISTAEMPDGTGEFIEPNTTFYRASFARQIVAGLHAGVNLNLIHDDLFMSGTSYTFDIGLFKTIEVRNGRRFSFGASLFNMAGPKITYVVRTTNPNIERDNELVLPLLFRSGAMYQTAIGVSELNGFALNTFAATVQVEYQDLFNADIYDGFRAGAQLSFLEMIHLRAGYYREDLGIIGMADTERQHLDDFTYGVGIEVPVNKLTRTGIPLIFCLDMTSLKQPVATESFLGSMSFSVYSLSVNWQITN
jgi:hypothetical protein